MIHTLCHELMHVMTHPVFNQATAKVENAMVIKEGFPELLAFELYTHLIRKAHGDPGLAKALTNGLAPGDLPSPPPRSEMDYGDAAQRAAAVMDSVGEKRVVTAFFLGKPHLVGVGTDL